MAADSLSIHVLFFVPRLDKASTRYRVSQFLPALEGVGITWEVCSVSRTSRHWPRLLRRARRADVVFIQKKLFSLLEITMLRKFSQRLIYDLDDAVMFKDNQASSRQLARQRRRFAATVQRADLVIAGNHYLREQSLQYQEHVVEIPTSLDLEHYTPRGCQENPQIVLGWIGSRGTLRYLYDIAPALEEIGRRIPGLRLKIVADDFFDLRHLAVEKKQWREDEEVTDLHSFDIGLMPLRDDTWTRGKCGFKLLQNMAVGSPVICSPVGANRSIVSDRVEGFYADSAEEWIARLEELVRSPRLRSEMGRKGRKKVAQFYSLEANAPRLIRALRAVHRRESFSGEAQALP